MNQEGSEQAESIFLDALDVKPEDRTAYVASRCGDDSQLRAQVLRLLAEDAAAGSFLETPVVPMSRARVFRAGDLLAGRFRVIRFIDSGGMGDVYEAEDIELKEHVALKTVRPEIAADPSVINRFKREIHLSRKVTHRNVCRIFDLQRHRTDHGEDVTFLTMELLDGETLASALHQRGRFTADEAAPIVRQVVVALDAAHHAGVVHRDFKSGNVMLVPDGEASVRAVVTDFGLARPVSPGSATTQSLSMGPVVGTPAYMAPEQVTGGEITPAADIYALGVVLFEMLTGAQPFSGATPWETASKRLTEEPPSPRSRVPALSRTWERAVLRCLQRRPEDRFATVNDVVRALEGRRVPIGARARRRLVAAALLLSLSIAGEEVGRRYLSVRVHQRTSVAVLGFRNATGATDAAWVGTELAEGLRTQLASTGKMRTVSGEEVASIRRDLAIPEFDSLGRETLARIHTTGADLVVLGSYTSPRKPGPDRVHVNVNVQDAASGETVQSLSADGSEGDLAQLVSIIGAQLRTRLGLGELTPEKEREIALSQPSPEAAPFYAEGLAKLRNYDVQQARDLLEKAVAVDNNYAFAHSALAEAWAILGYDNRARDEARKAFELSPRLSLEDSLFIEGRYRVLQADWPTAIDKYSELFTHSPDNVEYGLRLAESQRSGGHLEDALRTLRQLRALPSGRNDPRIDLEEAETAAAASDVKVALAAAQRATVRAGERGARLLQSRALNWTCSALQRQDQLDQARSACEAAQRITADIGDRLGRARALTGLGNIHSDRGELGAALDMYQGALTLATEVGARRDMSGALNNIAGVYASQGDLDQAEASYARAIALQREIGFVAELPRTLSNLGELLIQRGDFDRAETTLSESRDIARGNGNKALQAFALQDLGTIRFLHGNLNDAGQLYDAALRIRNGLPGRRDAATTMDYIADLLLARGNLDEAERQYRAALKIQQDVDDRSGLALSRIGLARTALEKGDGAGAAKLAEAAVSEFQAEHDVSGEILARCAAARAYLAVKDKNAALRHANAAEDLASKLPDPVLNVATELLSADRAIDAADRDSLGRAKRMMMNASAIAQRHHLIGFELECDLRLAQLDLRAGRVASARKNLAALRERAAALGYGLIAAKAIVPPLNRA